MDLYPLDACGRAVQRAVALWLVCAAVWRVPWQHALELGLALGLPGPHGRVVASGDVSTH